MDIKEDEIKEIKQIGRLHSSEVKLITLKGGFHIGVGKKRKNSNKSEILAVGSHPALVSHQIEKKYKTDFEQSMNKNEGELPTTVENFSHHLTSAQKDVLGLDIYSIKKGEEIDFKITKHNFEIFSIHAENDGDNVTLLKTEKNEDKLFKINKKELSKNLQETIKEYASKNGLNIKKKF